MVLSAIMKISAPKTVAQLEEHRVRVLLAGQKKALRAPANRSQLDIAEHRIMHAIGHHRWKVSVNALINFDIFESERAYQAECWRAAMTCMQKFYTTAAKRKDIQL